jgi:hypothetical protein
VLFGPIEAFASVSLPVNLVRDRESKNAHIYMGPHKDFSLMGPNFGIMGKPTAPVKV